MTQKNDFKNANFYGNTQIVNGDVHNVHTQNTPNSINENRNSHIHPGTNLEKPHYDGLADMG